MCCSPGGHWSEVDVQVTEAVMAVSAMAWLATLHWRLTCSRSLEARIVTEAVTSPPVTLSSLVTTAVSVTSLV